MDEEGFINVSLSPIDRMNIKKYDKRRKKKLRERVRLMELARVGDLEAIEKLKKKYQTEIK